MVRIGVVCAMQKEFDLIVKAFPDEGVFCLLSGIGKVNAAMAAEQLISQYKPDCILSIGCAGTFVEGLNEGEAVIVDRCAYHDVWCGKGFEYGVIPGLPQYFDCDKSLVQSASESLPQAHVGLLCTGDQFYISQEEDARQKSWFPEAMAIDMEGTAVAQVAFCHKVPFLAVKIISDNHIDGHQRARYDNFWETMAEKSFAAVKSILEKIQKQFRTASQSTER